MSTIDDGDSTAIAETYNKGDFIPVDVVKDLAKSYAEQLEMPCSPIKVLVKMENT